MLARQKGWHKQRDFKRIVEFYADTAASNEAVEAVQSLPATSQPPSTPPDLSRFGVGTADQLNRLSLLRGFSMEGLQLASQRGFLIFGLKHNFEVYGVKDQSGLLGEVRRLDGQWFASTASTPAHKSHTLKGSSKNWPLGIVEAAGCSKIAMTEGLPDFLACFDFIHREHKVDVVSPVAMLAASVVIDSQALPRFINKQVRLYPHYDQAGVEAAKRWTRQLKGIAASISYFKFSEFDSINDLADLNRCFNTNPTANIEILL